VHHNSLPLDMIVITSYIIHTFLYKPLVPEHCCDNRQHLESLPMNTSKTRRTGKEKDEMFHIGTESSEFTDSPGGICHISSLQAMYHGLSWRFSRFPTIAHVFPCATGVHHACIYSIILKDTTPMYPSTPA